MTPSSLVSLVVIFILDTGVKAAMIIFWQVVFHVLLHAGGVK